jgi:hypothetical protein
VIDVQMGAHDEVHLLGGDAYRGEIVEIGTGPHVPRGGERTSLVVADAGVDEDRVTRRLHDVRLDARGEITSPLVEEVRLEPAMVAGDDIGARAGQHGRGRKRRAVDLDHA